MSNDGIQYAKLEEADRIYDFLAGLNPKFDTVYGRILRQRSLPSLMEVCFEVRLKKDRTNVMVKWSSNEKQNTGHAHIRETTTASTSQSTGSTANQTKTLTLGLIAQSDMSLGSTIGTARHSGRLYILDDDTSGSNISRASSLSFYFALLNMITLIRPNLPLGLSHSVFVEYPLHQRGYKCFHLPSRKYSVTMDVLFVRTDLTFRWSSSESNSTLEFIEPTPSTVSDFDPHPIVLPTNQVPWKTYYKRNLIKEVGSPTSQSPAPVQDFEHPRDQGFNNNEAEQGHTRKLDEYDPSLDIPIALRKECPEWKNAVMEEIRLLKRIKLRRFVLYLRDTKLWDANRRSLSNIKLMELLTDTRQDVKNAFLNGDLVEEVYPLPRFEVQFGRQSQGYSQGHSDHTLFTKFSKIGKIAALIVYVDDIVLSGDDQTEINQLKQRMSDEFEIKDLGNLKYFLGLEMTKSKEGISFMQVPYEKHMEAVNRILRYLKMTLGFVLDKKSTSSYCTFVWGNLVTWRNKKQSDVIKSSAETEYRDMSLGISAIDIANNPIQHDRTKHVEIDRHFIKERLDSGSISILYIPSSQQVADVLTKGLLRLNFDLCVSKLGLIDIYVPT
ncbi:putative mitochondrial protein [Cucumis melo var. makuwa]|uniref:Mitochondrial protein n=1 Tax=Cucumis melo var. makuwa TaxID=1194695 RepID=A0A5A7T4M7_CUCMM|nr:putative mitochondrial protein [Cucumis melo var. makuwa]